MDESEIINVRKEKMLKFLKEKYNWISYVVLAILVWIAVKIRTSNLRGLKDITTGGWTLGPDLDPFLFLRWAEYIVEQGKLMAVDVMRYVPLGFNTNHEYLLHVYMIAWFHKFLIIFGLSDSVTYSAVIFPAFVFGLTVVAFFLMTREIFSKIVGGKRANAIALISSFFLSVMPALLPRTIAGIPEKESAAFLFFFLAFYFILAAWKSDNWYSRYIFAVLAGASTAGMANIWGGYQFIFLAITPAVFIAFLLGHFDREKIVLYTLWLFSSYILMVFGRHSLIGTVSSLASGSSLAVLIIILVHLAIFGTGLKKYFASEKWARIPPKILSTVVSVVLLILLISVTFGPSFIVSQLKDVLNTLIRPATTRLIQTVAENRQPYFSEWESNFGPHVRDFALSFWLMFVGSIYLFRDSIKKIFSQGETRKIVFAYVVLLTAIIFSRYSGATLLNGENFISKFVYALGFAIFVIVCGFYYYKYHRAGKIEELKKINFEFLLLFSLFFLSIVAARAAVRTIMMLVPPISIIIAYFAVASLGDALKVKEKTFKFVSFCLVGLVLVLTLFSAYGLYQEAKSLSAGYVPSIYTQQWQKAMSWVRTSTPENAVFGHWWDYGYWVQSIGERATVLDGGNAFSYWNHMMGRYALTGPDEREALEFLYVHNTTHFLIDSTDIGKYSAFSSIGSDVNYDRASFIPTFLRDDSQVQEKKNSTVFVYTGGAGLDQDIIYEDNGTKIFLPSGNAGLGAVLVEKNKNDEVMSNPRGIFVYGGQQYNLPLRYAFDGEFKDFGSGVESGIFLIPKVERQENNMNIKQDGALLYLSSRTVKSQLTKLYLYKQDTGAFKLAHSEDDFLVASVKVQGAIVENDILYFEGIRGPIRIWEIHYPSDIKFDEKYLSTIYPEELWRA